MAKNITTPSETAPLDPQTLGGDSPEALKILPEITPEEIAEKTRAGLSRDQAIEVITAQHEWDRRD